MPASRIVKGSLTNNVKPPTSLSVVSPMLDALMDMKVGDSFTGNWKGRNGVYASVKRFKKLGFLPPEFRITIKWNNEGLGMWRVFRMS